MSQSEDGAKLIRDNELWFDAGDKLNGSLYLCRPIGSPAESVTTAIDQLRASGLWSSQPAKSVADEQKPAYEAQMRFVESASVEADGYAILLARYDHPKFPSSAERFAAWKKAFGL